MAQINFQSEYGKRQCLNIKNMEDRQKREGEKRNHNNQTNKKLNVKKNGKKTN